MLLLLISGYASAGDYEIAERKASVCKQMGDYTVDGVNFKKKGVERATLQSSIFQNKFGDEIIALFLQGYDLKEFEQPRAYMIGWSKCMDRFSQ